MHMKLNKKTRRDEKGVIVNSGLVARTALEPARVAGTRKIACEEIEIERRTGRL
jgi:hypothetical protein